ncbi:MAG: IS21 family transposase [Gammaproteobacteria bacterium]|nr:IS21 family transposase [Gammaproteobacteria bacterium]
MYASSGRPSSLVRHRSDGGGGRGEHRSGDPHDHQDAGHQGDAEAAHCARAVAQRRDCPLSPAPPRRRSERRPRSSAAPGGRVSRGDRSLARAARAAPVNVAALHDWLVAEHGYPGSLRSVQRFVGDVYPRPPRRARRRVETPPGAQAQVDWAQFPGLIVAGREQTLHAFHMVLSHSRFDAIVWMTSEDQLSWLSGHNGAFTRLGGIPAVVRVDNTKTAVVHGAGAWGELNASYRAYARAVRFHIDPCAPYSPEHKGKVERAVRTQRFGPVPAERAWDSVEELQVRTDAEVEHSARRRRCPATGTSVWEAWHAERERLAPLPILPVPFDHVATRRVAGDALVAFEGHQYSVPFANLAARSRYAVAPDACR